MCDIGKAIGRMFTPSGTGALEAQLEGQQAAATAAAKTASDALTAAIKGTQQAAVPPADNPSAIAAAQAQMRKLMAAQGSAWSFGNTPTAAPTVGTKALMGV